MGSIQRHHVVCVPFPAQGHVNPMLKLAKILIHKGFYVTFVNTEYNHRRLIRSRGPDSLSGFSSIRFETIPDGLPFSDADVTQDVPSLCHSTTNTCLGPLRELVGKLNQSSEVPPVTCIVADGVMSFSVSLGKELDIPCVLFWTTSACGFLGYTYFKTLVDKGYAPFKDPDFQTNGSLDTVLDLFPAMKGIRMKEIPSFIRTTDRDDILLNVVLNITEQARSASAIVFNTFEDLEPDALQGFSSFPSPVYAIGPLQLIQKRFSPNAELKDLKSNLWVEDAGCLKWIEDKEANSVVYVNFGSVALLTKDQLTEFAWGLADSELPFLWIIRPDLVSGENAVLPPQFLEETKERSFLASWCDQESILGHPSIGGFLTHNGWNSTFESIWNGVPMLCWPFFAEQPINCWYSCNKWGIGMEIDNNVKRNDVKNLVLDLMKGDKGKEMKNKAMEWKKKAQESAQGSSYYNLEVVINDVLLAKSK